MKKMLLVDGNSMLFRAFYATIYGQPMKTSKGIPTNAIYGFYRMFEKAIQLVQPETILVAFDTGRVSFRTELYQEYKGTRKEPPEELKVQFPLIRQLLDAMHVARYEQEGVEADDIIGSMVQKYPDWDINILSSDKDLLQLIDPTTSVWLMKKGISEIVEMDEKSFQEEYGLVPKQIIDLKALMGDASDNIPGVPGIGEKTALKLIKEYQSVENLYQHTEDLKGKQKETIENNKEIAFLSKILATIKCDVEIPLHLDELNYQSSGKDLFDFFKLYEMNSLLKYFEMPTETVEKKETTAHKVADISNDLLEGKIAVYFDGDSYAYGGKLFGIAFSNGQKSEYISLEEVMNNIKIQNWLSDGEECYVYDLKGARHLLQKANLAWHKQGIDIMLAEFLVDTNITDWNKLWEKRLLSTQDESKKIYRTEIDVELQLSHACGRAYDTYKLSQTIFEELKEKELIDLYYNVELPLAETLFLMENEGVFINQDVLNRIATNTMEKMESISAEIYSYTKEPFNLNSPKQLAEILFDELELPNVKKRSTAVEVLEKLITAHPIISLIMEYRKHQKLYSTYAEGLKKYISIDGKIHTNYRQTVTQTGRLSSIDPNLQNISVREEAGREIRKAFVSSADHVLLSSDYSQIELRVLADMAREEKLMNAFRHDLDIHTQTAMEIFNVTSEQVDANMRRQAKAVNFGIVYGISDFGLAEQIGCSRKEAQEFIERYFDSYPNIKTYMDEQIAYCQENGYVLTMLKRRREIPEIQDSNYMIREFGKRAAMNAPIQGTAADLIKIAMLNTQRRILEEKLNTKMILQVHDELVFDVPLNELEKIIQLVQEEMTQALILEVPLKVEIHYGENWFEAK